MASSDSLKAGFNSLIKRTDPDTEAKVRSSVRFLNETIQYNANEPSLALYRMQVSPYGNRSSLARRFHP